MTLVFVDTETIGLASQCVLIQYAFDDGPIHLHDVWLRPVGETIDLIESFLPCTVVGFNLVFDWFHLAKLYTQWKLLPRDFIPISDPARVAAVEMEARDGDCIKPAGACDLLLHSRKGPYQALMGRDDVRVRKVPAVLAQALADELEKRVQIDGIFFAKSKTKDAPKWKVFDRVDSDGDKCPHWKDVVLHFDPAGGLKFLAEYALGIEPKAHFDDVGVIDSRKLIEYGYAPFAYAAATAAPWEVIDPETQKLRGYAWPALIHTHVEHWRDNARAREYAHDDIVYTRALYEHFGRPEANDDDSVLACMVGAIRWHGYTIDRERLERITAECNATIAAAPINTNRPAEVREYLRAVMSPDEYIASKLADSTEKGKLEAIRDLKLWQGTEAQKRAAEILQIKTAHKVRDAARKILLAGRFHAAFDVLGAKSARMSGSGSGGLNPQGQKNSSDFRSAFPLAWEGMELCGGDFSQFELSIMDAVYDDPRLRAVLTGKQKIHALFAMQLFPDLSYDDVMRTEGQDDDKYTKGKRGVFGRGYGSEAPGMAETLGVDVEQAQRAIDWFNKFEGVGKNFAKLDKLFSCLVQPGGEGSAVFWREPQAYVESFLGFRRWFTLEIKIIRALFDLARSVPGEWKKCNVKVQRSMRTQTAGGAVASALYGCAFGMAASMKRQAANHEIQSPGGQICKAVQRAIWDLQPVGVHAWVVAPMNVHDEIQCPTAPAYVRAVTCAVNRVVSLYLSRIPLIAIKWVEHAATWAEKKSGEIKLPSTQSEYTDH